MWHNRNILWVQSKTFGYMYEHTVIVKLKGNKYYRYTRERLQIPRKEVINLHSGFCWIRENFRWLKKCRKFSANAKKKYVHVYLPLKLSHLLRVSFFLQILQEHWKTFCIFLKQSDIICACPLPNSSSHCAVR